MEDWRAALSAEWARRRAAEEALHKGPLFPLACNPFGEEEILAMADVLLSGRLTLGEKCENAEKQFAAAVGAPYAIMVNSGSSANLLAVAAMANKMRSINLVPGDEVLIPAVCWSTSLHPLLQCGLKPVFVDVSPKTFNVDLLELERVMNPRVKAVMAVHVMGNAICMTDLINFVTRHKLVLIEDTCESLGSFYFDAAGKKCMLGTAGDFGAYSFYFSHHITSGEGGMVVCKTLADYNLVRCLRAHGWTRHLTDRTAVELAHPDVDSRFLFINVGYNVRPMEVQGVMLSVQLTKLDGFNACRRDNVARIIKALTAHPLYRTTMSTMEAGHGVDPAWFGMTMLLNRSFAHQLNEYLVYLMAHGIENRPIISGNFIRQPVVAAYCSGERPEDYPGAEAIHTRGFFIGVHQIAITEEIIAKLVDIMMGFEFKPRHVVLVTGGSGMLGRHVQAAVTAGETSAEWDWVFVGRKDGDLRVAADVEKLFKRHQPSHVLHLAARLASIQEMTANPVEFWLDNVTVNNNILHTAFKFQAWVGPIKVVSVLSTVMFPKDATFPVGSTAEELYGGRLHSAAEAYAMAKRSLCQLSQWYRTQHGAGFSCVLPSNFFGPHGDFNPSTAPLINALIARAEIARTSSSTEPLKVLGTGLPERQVMTAGDLARATIWALKHYDDIEPLIIAGKEVSIKSIAELVCAKTEFTGGLQFESSGIDGPLRRTADTSRFEVLCPTFQFTPVADGIAETIFWYRANRA